MGDADVFLEGFTVFQLLLIFVFGGGLVALIGVLWKIAKRDSILDTTLDSIAVIADRISKLEGDVKEEDDELDIKL